MRFFQSIALALLCPAAMSGDLQVAPISLQFGDSEVAKTLSIRNSGAAPVRVQIRVYEWTQSAGVDQLGVTRDVVASPPLATLLAGERQTVRIVRPSPVAASRERGYRVIVDELPPDLDGGSASHEQSGLRLLLRYSIPAFVAPRPADSVPAPSTSLGALVTQWTGGLRPRLRIENSGPRRIRISSLVHESREGKRSMLTAGLLGYVLAGSSMEWDLPRAASLGPGTLKARLNDDAVEHVLAASDGS